MSELKKTDFLEFSIVNRETNEWIGRPGDSHVISPTLRQVLTSYGNHEFMNAKHSLTELGMIADKLETPVDLRQVGIRDALFTTRFAAEQLYFVPVTQGYVMTDMLGWMKASSSIPEVQHIVELASYMAADPATRKLPKPFVADERASAEAVGALALSGDPVARRLAPAFGVKGLTSDQPAADAKLSGEQVPGRLLPVARGGNVVKFTEDLRGFLIRDGVNHKPILAGDAFRGVTQKFAGFHPPGHEEAISYAGPRMR